MQSTNIAYYITNHGYGHGVRTSDVIRALGEQNPSVRLTLITGLPPAFLRNRISGIHVDIQNRQFDFGMEQIDSVRVDVPETLRKITALYDKEDTLVDEEAEWLKRQEIDTVVCDIPAMPLLSAAKAGIPSIAVANFTWAWIYEEFSEHDSRWQRIIDRMNAAYAQADLLLRTPFAENLQVFPRRKEIGLLARPGNADRTRLANLSGADPERKWVLLSFTTLEWNESALKEVAALKDYAFFTVVPLAWNAPNIFPIEREEFPVADLFASVDVVLSKPGFGVLSECVANRKPILYVERENFREYPVLETALKRNLTHLHIPSEDLYRGLIGEYLSAIQTAAPPLEPLTMGGDLQAAQAILSSKATSG